MPSTMISRIDGLTTSVAVKAPIKIMTSSPITLFGEQTINAVTPAGTNISETVLDGDRVGVNGQVDETTNGIYVVRTTNWTRAKDFDGSLDAVFGTLVTDSIPIIWRLTTPIPVLFGTSNIKFTSVSGGVSATSDGVYVDNIFLLKSLSTSINQRARVLGFYVAGDGGGGDFYWDATAPKSNHNGGTIISPSVPFSGTRSDVAAFLAGTGETLPAGSGCWRRVVESAIDIRWFGAYGADYTFDNYSSIQASLNAAGLNAATDTSKTSIVQIPPGTFAHLAALVIPDQVSMYGCGIISAFAPRNCDGIKVGSSDVVGGRFLRDFAIMGDGNSAYKAITFDPGQDQLKRMTGFSVSNIYIAFFKYGVFAKGLWHSKFTNVIMNNCFNGMELTGHCVSVNVDSCKMVRGSITQTGDNFGIRISQATDYTPATTRRPEAIRISNESLVYGYDIGISAESCLNFSVTNCDLDYCQKRGVTVLVVDGGCVIDDNWIAGDGDGGQLFYGVEMSARGTDTGQRQSITSNNISMTGNPVAGCIGIYLGSLHGNSKVSNNNVYSGFGAGLLIDQNCTRNEVTANTLNGASDGIFLASSGNHFSNNTLGGALNLLNGDLRNSWGKSAFATTRELIEVIMPAGATSSSVTLAALGLTATTSNQRFYLRAYQSGTISQGHTWAEYNQATQTVSIYTSIAVGVKSEITVEMVAR